MPPIPAEQVSPHGNGFAPLAYNMRVAPKVSGISKSKLYQLAADGKLKLTRVGGRTLVEHTELMRLIREGYAA
jgi:excisionase family DNA binding protein